MEGKQLVKRCEGTEKFTTWYREMDENMSLYNLEAFTIKDYKNQKIARADNVTLPAIATFTDHATTIAGGVLPQIKVRSKAMEEEQRSNVKNFLYGAFEEANSLLARQGKDPFHIDLALYGALKRLVAMRVTVTREGEKTQFRLIPIDPRNFTYRMGVNGVVWAGYKMMRDPEDIYSEYGIEVKKETEVLDWWDSEENVVYIGGEEVRNKNLFGYPPFVIVPMKHTIYKNCKDIYNQMNKTATILKSTSMQSFMGGMQFHSDRYTDKIEYPSTGTVTELGNDEKGFELVKLPDVYQATAFIWQIESSEFQRATVANIDYGGLEFPLSGTALDELKEGRDQILFPLLQATTTCYKETCNMMIRQFKQGGLTAELGEDETIATYTAPDLPDPGSDCNIKFVFKTTVVAEQGAAYQMASLAREWLPEDVIREEILKVDNAHEMADRVWAERAMQLYPELAQARIAIALERLGMKEELKLIQQRLENPEIEQPMQPQQKPVLQPQLPEKGVT